MVTETGDKNSPESWRAWQKANFSSFIRIYLTKQGVEVVKARGDSVFEVEVGRKTESVWIGPLWLAFSIFQEYLKPEKNLREVFSDPDFHILVDKPAG